jgi:hypothetical protein
MENPANNGRNSPLEVTYLLINGASGTWPKVAGVSLSGPASSRACVRYDGSASLEGFRMNDADSLPACCRPPS